MTFSPLAVNLAILVAVVVSLALITHAIATWRERSVEASFPPLGQFISVHGRKVHLVTKGSGPDLILIHGASGNVRDLGPLIDRLAPSFRVTAFDRPGLGWSDPIPQGSSLRAQTLHLSEAASQLGIADPVILGQSYGGSVALAWALFAPLKPRALVLVSAPSLPWPGRLDFWYRLTRTRLGQTVVIPLATAFVPAAYIDQTIIGIFAPDRVPSDYRSYVGAGLSLRRPILRTNAAQVNSLRSEIVALQPLYPTLSLPIELIHGDADTIVPLTIHSGPLSSLLPGARLTVLPGTGHMPHHAQSDVVLAAIVRAAQSSALC